MLKILSRGSAERASIGGGTAATRIRETVERIAPGCVASDGQWLATTKDAVNGKTAKSEKDNISEFKRLSSNIESEG